MYSVHTNKGDGANINSAISNYSNATKAKSGSEEGPRNTVAAIRARAASQQTIRTSQQSLRASQQSSICNESIAEE